MRTADLIAADLEAASERLVMGLLSPHAELMREAAEALRSLGFGDHGPLPWKTPADVTTAYLTAGKSRKKGK